MIAPPTFVHTCDDTHVIVGLPGYQGLYLSAFWRYLRPIRVGTVIRKRLVLSRLEEKETRFGGHMVIQHVDFTFTDGTGEAVVQGTNATGRVVPPEGEMSGGIRYESREDTYRDADLARIRAARAAYRRRGPVPRLWEDVVEGEEVGPLVFGPLTTLDFAAYYAGNGNTGPLPNSVELTRWRHQHGGLAHGASRTSGIYIDATGFHAYPGRAHLDARLALQMGMPGAFDLGAQRVTWCAWLMTDWAGDAGWLAELEVQIRRPLVIGDTSWLRGRVVEKVRHEGKPAVRIEFHDETQRGELTTRGSAVVQLPSRQR